MGDRITRILVVILLVATVIRVSVVLVRPFYFPDSKDYENLGRAIAHGGDYIADGWKASRMPGYPLYLGLCYRLFSDSTLAALLVQAVVGGVTGVWAYLLCSHWNRKCGLLAAGLVSVDPLSMAFSASLLTETLFTFFMLGSLVALQRLGRVERRGLWGWAVWLVVSWVCAVYLRPSILWCAVPIVLWHAWLAWRKRDGLRINTSGRLALVVGVLYAATALSLVPWWQRNMALFHTGYFRMTTLDGKFLYESLSPETTGVPALEKVVTPPDMLTMNEGEQADEFKRRAWAFAKADPWRQVRMAFVKAGRTWNPLLNASEFQSISAQIVMAAWHLPLYLAAALGVFAIWKRPWDLGICLWPMVYFTLIHVVYLGSVRYRVPLMPLLCVLGACGCFFAIGLMRGREQP